MFGVLALAPCSPHPPTKWPCPGDLVGAVAHQSFPKILRRNCLLGSQNINQSLKKAWGINCLHNELVMEVMWGMKHLMHKLVPGEKSQLSMKDRPPMSQGLQILLRRYGFDVEPEMVNEQIVATARILFKCDDVEKKEYQNLCLIRHYLKKVSGIDYESWDPLKLATAFKIISRSEAGDSDKMFPEDVISKLLSDADKYDAKINKVACLRTYSQVASAHRVRAFKRNELGRLVKKAKKVYQAELVEVICL